MEGEGPGFGLGLGLGFGGTDTVWLVVVVVMLVEDDEVDRSCRGVSRTNAEVRVTKWKIIDNRDIVVDVSLMTEHSTRRMQKAEMY